MGSQQHNQIQDKWATFRFVGWIIMVIEIQNTFFSFAASKNATGLHE